MPKLKSLNPPPPPHPTPPTPPLLPTPPPPTHPPTDKELLIQDHSAPLTPPRFCGNRRFVSMMVRVGRRMTKPLRVMMRKNGRPKRMVKELSTDTVHCREHDKPDNSIVRFFQCMLPTCTNPPPGNEGPLILAALTVRRSQTDNPSART